MATLDTPHAAAQSIQEQRWPLLVKLHGDFHSNRLKNITQELQDQDAALRKALVETCQSNGLAVVGYSGRDESVMAALEENLKKASAFPFGLFLVREAGRPSTQAGNRFDSRAVKLAYRHTWSRSRRLTS